MRWRRRGALAGLALALLVAPPHAEGQVSVRLTGQIDNNGGIETSRSGGRTFETITTGSQYTPNLDGFIWNPRFLTFSLGGTYANQDTTIPGGEITFLQRDPYRLQLNLFPQATHSFGVLASRTVTDNRFSGSAGEIPTTSTVQRQGFTWTYRGNPVLPETSLDFKRETTENETLAALAEETRTTITLRAHKSFARNRPALTYTVEMLDTGDSQSLGTADTAGVSHQAQYEDRVRVGERAFLTPTAEFRVAPGVRSGTTTLNLAGPLSSTLDGSTGLRYAVQDVASLTTQTVATDGVLTKRFSPTLTLTSGMTGTVTNGDGTVWSAGGFTGVTALPLSHLQTAGDYGVQLTGGELPVSVSQRGHVGAVSTYVPRHTLTADYFINVFDRGGGQPLFTSHSVALGATSVVIPLTTLTGRYAVDFQEAEGQQHGQRASLGAVVIPVSGLSLRAGGDADTRSTSGGGRAPTEETGYGAEAGVDVSPLSWVTLSVSGRRAVRDVEREDKIGRFVSEVVRGTATVSFRTLQFVAEGFLEREPIIDQVRKGVRGSASYRFRIWTLTLEFERSRFTVTEIDTDRDRLFFRITRPINFSWSR